MSLVLVAVVLVVCAGAVVAVSTRDWSVAATGLAVALVASALLSDPLPSVAILGVRVVAGLLVAAILRVALRGSARQPSPLGWPAEALVATAGAVAGLGLSVGLATLAAQGGVPIVNPGPDGAAGGGSAPTGEVTITAIALIVAAGAGLLAIGVPALTHPAAGGRRAIGLVLVTQAVLLMRIGIAGPSVELEEIARAALLVVSGATGAVIARAAAAVVTRSSDDPERSPDPRALRV